MISFISTMYAGYCCPAGCNCDVNGDCTSCKSSHFSYDGTDKCQLKGVDGAKCNADNQCVKNSCRKNICCGDLGNVDGWYV